MFFCVSVSRSACTSASASPSSDPSIGARTLSGAVAAPTRQNNQQRLVGAAVWLLVLPVLLVLLDAQQLANLWLRCGRDSFQPTTIPQLHRSVMV
jgi:hypothetical protein